MTFEPIPTLHTDVDEADFKYAWIITSDLIGDGSAVGVSSKSWNDDMNLPLMFRLLDDDGEVYYMGYSNDRWTERAFRPLDDYGMPNDGCTEIQYLVNDKWETL